MLDADAYINAYKGLVIIFIIFITIANGLLIFTTVRKHGFLYRPRSLIIISLAFGDIFLALFSLIVNARIVFEAQTLIMSCSTVRAALVYSIFLIHFVYGVGLITLAVEMLIRYKRKNAAGSTCTTVVTGVVVSAVPWLIGLVVVLPLTMAGSEVHSEYWEDSRCANTVIFGYLATTFSRSQAMYSVSVLVPACLAVVVCIAVMCVRLTSALYIAQYVPQQGATPGVVLSTHTTTSTHQQYPMNIAPSAQPFPTIQEAAHHNQLDSHPVPTTTEFNSSKSQHTPSPTQYPTQYPTQQYTSQSNVIISAPGTYPVLYQNTTVPVMSDPTRERILLLAVSIVYFICVVPFASFFIGLTHFITYGSDASIIILIIFYWLAVFRSFITPIICMVCSRSIVSRAFCIMKN